MNEFNIQPLKIGKTDKLYGAYNFWIVNNGINGANFIKVLSIPYHDLARPYVTIHKGLLTQIVIFKMGRSFNYYGL